MIRMSELMICHTGFFGAVFALYLGSSIDPLTLSVSRLCSALAMCLRDVISEMLMV